MILHPSSDVNTTLYSICNAVAPTFDIVPTNFPMPFIRIGQNDISSDEDAGPGFYTVDALIEVVGENHDDVNQICERIANGIENTSLSTPNFKAFSTLNFSVNSFTGPDQTARADVSVTYKLARK
jgi:hypothetical protein